MLLSVGQETPDYTTSIWSFLSKAKDNYLPPIKYSSLNIEGYTRMGYF